MANYLTSESDIKEVGNLLQVPDAVITPRVSMASRDVKRLVGDTYYAELLEMEVSAAERIDCTQAESLIGAAKTMLVIAHDTSGKGVVGSNILGDAHSEFISYESIRKRAADLRAEAESILAPYLYDPDSEITDEDQNDSVHFPGGSMWIV